MRVALINPNWNFDGSIYFGCRAPHLPLEFGHRAIWVLDVRQIIVRVEHEDKAVGYLVEAVDEFRQAGEPRELAAADVAHGDPAVNASGVRLRRVG